MVDLDEIEVVAAESAGNWKKFAEFVWSAGYDLEDRDQWAIFYTNNRDSRLQALSNAAAIEKELEPFTEDDDPDVMWEHHKHWAYGWANGYSVRVYKDGQITDAFRKHYEIQCSLSEHCVLDDRDYSKRELEATLENIEQSAYSLKHQYKVPEGWQLAVYKWLSDNNDSAIANNDDQGGYPDEDEIEAAFKALGYTE